MGRMTSQIRHGKKNMFEATNQIMYPILVPQIMIIP